MSSSTSGCVCFPFHTPAVVVREGNRVNELLALWQYLLSLTFAVEDVELSTCLLGRVARLSLG